MSSFSIFLIILALGFLALVIVNARYRSQTKKMTIERKTLNINSFMQEFDKDVDFELLKSVYEGISIVMTGEAAKLAALPSDKISETYGFTDELGKQEFIESVLKHSGRSIDSYQSDPLYPDLVNVRDLVYLVGNQPLMQKDK